MSQTLPNYLTLPIQLLDQSNLEMSLRQRFIKQVIVSQVIYVYNVWRQTVDHQYNSQWRIGIIGCGSIGKLIISSLLPYTKKKDKSQLDPWQIHISTRRPDTLNDFSQNGLQIYFDNDRLIRECNFIILAIPPTLDHWSLLEFKDSIQARFSQPDKPFVLSLISNLTEEGIKSLLKIQVHKTNICLSLIQKGLNEYMGLVQYQLSQKKEKIFQTEVDEDIAKHLQKSSYLHYIDHQQKDIRISSLLRSLGQCLGMDNQIEIEEYYKNEYISQALMGRSQKEINDSQEHRKTLLDNLTKTSFDKRFFEYQYQIN